MNMDGGMPIWIGLIGVAAVGRLIADGMDRRRIRDHLAERGCQTIQIRWNPFGPGWFGEKSDRIYEVIYINESGKQVVANCKTSMFSGVYWRDRAESMQIPATDAPQTPAECLACGKPMGSHSRCPECGWSYHEK